MTHCEKCIHYPICKADSPYMPDDFVDFFPHNEDCKYFKPAADVIEVRHGVWREETEYYDDDYSECNVRKVYACSLCGRTEKRKEPYCNCGAKMDGGR